jgi:hypothetical protein
MVITVIGHRNRTVIANLFGLPQHKHRPPDANRHCDSELDTQSRKSLHCRTVPGG